MISFAFLPSTLPARLMRRAAHVPVAIALSLTLGACSDNSTSAGETGTSEPPEVDVGDAEQVDTEIPSGDANDPSQRPKEVVDYHDGSTVLGVADTELFTSVVASGIRFDVPENLRGATELFITVR